MLNGEQGNNTVDALTVIINSEIVAIHFLSYFIHFMPVEIR
jgi:hypothetical protein